MATRYAWVLNLDAEMELTRPLGYNPTARVRDSLSRFRGRLRGLVGPEDVVLPDDPLSKPIYKGFEGRAWCPTPRALRLLAKSGASVPAAPDLACLRRVCSRRFNAELGQPLMGAAYVQTRDALTPLLQGQSNRGGSVLKRDYGFTGRGQRRVRELPLPDDEKWITQALALGGLQCEPRVNIEAEFALHGWLYADGAAVFGAVCGQAVDEQGAWLSSTLAETNALPVEFASALRASTEQVAHALFQGGYFGPFGVDAYVYRNADGETCFNPKSDVNPRYTMGYGVGMHAWLDAERRR
jgi:hypothetical protein